MQVLKCLLTAYYFSVNWIDNQLIKSKKSTNLFMLVADAVSVNSLKKESQNNGNKRTYSLIGGGRLRLKIQLKKKTLLKTILCYATKL